MAFEPNIFTVATIGDGFLAIMPKPTTGEWIEEEFAKIAAFGIVQVVSLLEPEEAAELDLQDEDRLCEANGMVFVSYPIADRGLPSSLDEFSRFTLRLYREITAGRNTVIHCRAGIGRSGIGRSGIVGGAVLVHSGLDCQDAFDRISMARGLNVPDTDQQRDWLIQHQSIIQGQKNPLL